MSTKLLAVKAAIYEMGLRFNQEPSEAKINAYARDLMEYTPDQIIFAFRKVIDSGSAFFPSLAEIIKHLKPSQEAIQDKAPQVANEIIQLLRCYGQYDEVRMLENASEEARLTLLALGHTGDIRNSEMPDVVRAQLERLARGVLGSREATKKNEQLKSIGIETGKVLSMKKPGMKSLQFDSTTTEPA